MCVLRPRYEYMLFMLIYISFIADVLCVTFVLQEDNSANGCGFFQWASTSETVPVPPVEPKKGMPCDLLQDLKESIEKEKYAADQVAELCQRLLRKIDNLDLSK